MKHSLSVADAALEGLNIAKGLKLNDIDAGFDLKSGDDSKKSTISPRTCLSRSSKLQELRMQVAVILFKKSKRLPALGRIT